MSRFRVNTAEFSIPKRGYHDTSGTSAGTFQAGVSYPVEVDVHTDGDLYHEWVNIWLDLNQDGQIDPVAERVYSVWHEFATFRTFTGTISVPATAYNGTMYGRMIMKFDASPELCGGYSFGTTVDFVVNITGATDNPEALPSDPGADNDVIGTTTSHTQTSHRFAAVQFRNFHDRLDRLHSEHTRHGANWGINVSLPNTGISSTGFAYSPVRQKPLRNEAVAEAEALADRGNGAARATIASEEAPNYDQPFAFWSSGYVNFGTRASGAFDLDYTMVGISAGIDYRFSEQFVAGFGLGYGRDRTDIGSNGSQSRANGYTGVLYASYEALDNLFVDSLVGLGRLDFETMRYVPVSGLFAQGQRNGTQFFGSLTASYEYGDEQSMIAPFARIGLSRTWLDGYTETGAGAGNLTYADQTVDSLSGHIGVRASHAVDAEWGRVIPGISVEYSHEFSGNSEPLVGYSSSGTPAFKIAASSESRDKLTLGLNLGLEIGQATMLRFEYHGAYSGPRNLDHTFSAHLGVRF